VNGFSKLDGLEPVPGPAASSPRQSGGSWVIAPYLNAVPHVALARPYPPTPSTDGKLFLPSRVTCPWIRVPPLRCPRCSYGVRPYKDFVDLLVRTPPAPRHRFPRQRVLCPPRSVGLYPPRPRPIIGLTQVPTTRPRPAAVL